MLSKTCVLLALFIKAIASQRIVNLPQMYSETVIEKYSPSTDIPPLSPSDSDVMCKNLATAIQNLMLEKFAQNCYRQPVFGKIAGPLINEIKNTVCTCPACSTVNFTPSGYTKSYISPNVVSNIIKSNKFTNTFSNSIPKGNNVSVNRKYTDLVALLKGYGCECGCRGPVTV